MSSAVKECRVSAGHVLCKGEFIIAALCSVLTDSGTVCRSLQSRIPFAETLDGDGLTEEHRCEPDITVTSVTPTITEEGRSLGIDFCCDAAVICARDSETEIITDAYLPECDVRIQGEPHAVFRPLKTVYGAFSASAALSYDPQETIGAAVDTRMCAFFDRFENRDGRIVLDGSLDISVICMSDDGKYFPLNGTVPIRWDTDASGMPDTADLLPVTDCTVVGTTVRIDPSSNTVTCDAELSVALSLSAKETHALPRTLSVPPDSKTYTAYAEPLILCYPEPDETVWDIAKRYRIPPNSVLQANRIDSTAAPLSSASPLIIPIHPLFAEMKA